MKNYPSIALIEFESIAAGIFCADAMVKKAPISIIKSGTVHNGKYLVLVGGSVASVEESFREGLERGREHVVDKMWLPHVHPQVSSAIQGGRSKLTASSLATLEMATIASNIFCADAAVKNSEVNISEIRLGDDLGGKAITLFNGPLEEVERALEIAHFHTPNPEWIINTSIISRLSPEMIKQINKTTEFRRASADELNSGEF